MAAGIAKFAPLSSFSDQLHTEVWGAALLTLCRHFQRFSIAIHYNNT